VISTKKIKGNTKLLQSEQRITNKYTKEVGSIQKEHNLLPVPFWQQHHNSSQLMMQKQYRTMF